MRWNFRPNAIVRLGAHDGAVATVRRRANQTRAWTARSRVGDSSTRTPPVRRVGKRCMREGEQRNRCDCGRADGPRDLSDSVGSRREHRVAAASLDTASQPAKYGDVTSVNALTRPTGRAASKRADRVQSRALPSPSGLPYVRGVTSPARNDEAFPRPSARSR